MIWAVTGGLFGGVGTGATPLPRSVAEEVAMLLMLPEGLPPSASAAASSEAGFVVVGSGRGAAAAAAAVAARVGVVLSGGGLRREG